MMSSVKASVRRSKISGFTLIELLVVIAIIGILASIVLASLNTARLKSRDARRLADIKQLQIGLKLYFDAQGTQYPPATATCATPAGVGDDENRGLQVLVNKGYIPQIARDPGSPSTCYSYATLGSPVTTYHLGASMEDAGNPSLSVDKDCNSSTALPSAGSCGSAVYTQGFDGADAAGCAGEAGKACFDVVP